MNKVVLKKCDNAAMKRIRARIVLGGEGEKFISRAFLRGTASASAAMPSDGRKNRNLFSARMSAEKINHRDA
jgi:hypothetical protein